jgi:tetratricopeptide (TPR) repeat protein
MQSSMQEYLDKALAKEASGDLQEAETIYQEMIRISPLESYTYNNLGSLRARRGNYEGAFHAFQRAIENDANNVTAQFNLAKLCYLLCNYVGAELHFRKSIELAPEDKDIRANFYKMLRPQPEEFFSVAFELEINTDLSGADRIYRRAVEIIPGDPACLFMIGLVHFVKAEFPSAKAIFEKLTATDESFGLAWHFLANTFSAMGRQDKGIELADFVACNFMPAHFRRRQ